MTHSLFIAIVARTKNNVIGYQGKMPWHIPEDLKFFKQETLHSPMIMGRKTRDSFGINPLPHRPHLVLTHDPHYTARHTEIFSDFDMAYARAQEINQQNHHHKIYLIGGGSLYKQFLAKIDRIIISELEMTCEGDTFFPEFNVNDFSQKIIHDYRHLPIPFKVVEYDRLR